MEEALLGFPLWLRINHFINLFCIFVLMRSGVQILADHPKLYWNDNAMPGSEWIKFGKKVMPADRLWTSMDEAEHINSFVALPGGHHNLGASRNWHFLIIPVWVLNGLSYVTLLGVTGQWRRLIPTSWTVLSQAWESLLTYARFQIPPDSAFHPYDSLQQLTYAGIVFLVAPLMIMTGLCMSPALIARFPWYPRLFGGRQAARSLHFIGLMTLVVYTLVHLTLVVVVHFPEDISNMVLGSANPNIALAPVGRFDRVDWSRGVSYLGHHLYASPSTTVSSQGHRLHRTAHADAVRKVAIPSVLHESGHFAVLSGEWVSARIRDL